MGNIQDVVTITGTDQWYISAKFTHFWNFTFLDMGGGYVMYVFARTCTSLKNMNELKIPTWHPLKYSFGCAIEVNQNVTNTRMDGQMTNVQLDEQTIRQTSRSMYNCLIYIRMLTSLALELVSSQSLGTWSNPT